LIRTPRARVLVDTSVLFAAVRSTRGFARDLINAGIDGLADLVIGDAVLDETTRNLSKKGSAAEVRYFGDLITFDALRLVSPASDLVARVARSVEVKDAAIVAAALAAGAPMLATYDKRHLLSRAEETRNLFGVEVLTPDEVLRRLVADEEAPAS
jgi:predicted nucleic acid-binding protein